MPQAPRQSLAARPRITYGRSRSSVHDDDECSMDEPKASAGLTVRKRPSFLRKTTSSVSTESVSSEQQRQKALRASHELQEAGRGHRFQDELEYFLEGMQEKEKLQVRRTSCLELVRSMLKKDFAAHVLIHGHWPALARLLILSEDQILMACFAVMMAVLAQDPEACCTLSETDGLRDFILRGIDMEQDPFAVMPNNRRDMASINMLKDVVQELGIIRRGQKVLMSSILLALLGSLIESKVSQQPLTALGTDLMGEDLITKTFELLILDLAWLKQATTSPHMSLSDVIDLGRTNNILRILEAESRLSLAHVVFNFLYANPKAFKVLTDLLVLSRMHAFQRVDESDAATLMMHALRLLVNTTNTSTNCCTILAQCNAVPILTVNVLQLHGYSCRRQKLLSAANRPAIDSEKSGGGTQDWYDILLLSLGSIINMVEKSPSCRQEFLNSAIGLDCNGTGACYQGECTCEKSNQALERIIEMYKIEASFRGEDNILAAYLAVLIIRIVEDEEQGQDRLVRAVGKDGLRDMRLLLANFALLYEALLGETSPSSDYQRRHLEKNDGAAHGTPINNSVSIDDKVRQTHQAILTTIQILSMIQDKFE